jgi:hypothetical protein
MPSLHELQRGIARAILTGEGGEAAGWVAGDGLSPAARLQIYRNHFRITLGDALEAVFPATRSFLGEACFRGMARRYLEAEPPVRPCLFEFGESFPAFLASQPELAVAPAVPDLARLEWAIVEAFHAPDAPVLTSARLARLPAAALSGLRFLLHPAWRCMVLPFSVMAIWRACQPGSALLPDPLPDKLCTLLIGRDDDGDVVFRELASGEAMLLRRLRTGARLADAITAASADSAFDPASVLQALLDAGIFTNCVLDPDLR